MRKPSLVTIVVVILVLVAVGVSLRGEGGGRFTRWLASMHGNGGH